MLLLKDEILPRLERIKKICGPLCEIDSSEKLAAVTVVQSNNSNNNNNNNNNNNDDTLRLLLPQVRVPVDCKAIMESEDIDASDPSAPYPLPTELHHWYSLNGAIEIQHWKRFADILLGGDGLDGSTWDVQLIHGVMEQIKNGTHQGTYGARITNMVRDHLRTTDKIKDRRVLVIGSHIPWLEAICLLLGAKEVVTLEYGKITSDHPNLTTLTPSEFRGLYMNNTLGQFDTIVSFSSIEHSGLGRYGDALNPWGDLLAIARAWCVTKPGGALALGLPTGRDHVTMNAHRVYGKVRWPLVSANWVQVDSKLHSSSELEAGRFKAGVKNVVMVFEKLEDVGVIGAEEPLGGGTIENVAPPTAKPTSLKEAMDERMRVQKEAMDELLKVEIFPRLERIKKICGPLCDTDSIEKLNAITVRHDDNNTFLPQVKVPINCKAIMESEDIDAGDKSVPFPLPKPLHNLYTLNGAIRIRNWGRFNDIYLGGNARDSNTWNEELIQAVMQDLNNGTHKGTYGVNQTNKVRDHLRETDKIKDRRVLVIGSEKPWLEAICLLLGAKEVVTLEYGKITSDHPNLTTLTPSEFRGLYMNNTLGQFDTIVSFSSIEHSGLGRYGDALNPWGDLLAIARAWCVTKPGGALALGLPTGRDHVTMNAHRVYGKVRWPLVSANWVQVDSKLHNSSELEVDEYNGQWQSLMVFEKSEETVGYRRMASM